MRLYSSFVAIVHGLHRPHASRAVNIQNHQDKCQKLNIVESWLPSGSEQTNIIKNEFGIISPSARDICLLNGKEAGVDTPVEHPK